MKIVLPILFGLLLAACGSSPPRIERDTGVQSTAPAKPAPGRGGYYQDDGPGDNPPANLEQIADAVPRDEPLMSGPNRPYTVFGKTYVPQTGAEPFRQRGVASWYGRKFHGQRTSSGEIYDMYAMTAAHPTLPIPSYVRVTNPANGKAVIVRVNDRGPFHSDRIIDLSYAAAWKLGYLGKGSTEVELERIVPGEIAANASRPVAAMEPAKPPNAVVPATGNHYLQLGAFAQRENAEASRARVYQQLPWLNDPIVLEEAPGNLTRLLLGPYATLEAAQEMVKKIEDALQQKVLVLSR
ncbi:MAG: septal ring lytic transglycosylase RlpA family protein [Burkholderiaceae bacterium]|nr:MAG: septal ring lytic transglycosylase RlpA family protein [Burkholderiaceae bacterium]